MLREALGSNNSPKRVISTPGRGRREKKKKVIRPIVIAGFDRPTSNIHAFFVTNPKAAPLDSSRINQISAKTSAHTPYSKAEAKDTTYIRN